MDRPRRKRNEGSSFRLGSTAPCFPLLAGLVAVVKQAKKANDGRPRHEQKKIGTSNPPRLTEARHDGTEESGKRKSTNTIARTRTGAKLGSETTLYFVCFYVLLPSKLFTFAPAAGRNCCLQHWSPQHPFVNSKNGGPGIRGIGFSHSANRPQATSSGSLALRGGTRRDHFVCCRSRGDVGVRFIIGPKRTVYRREPFLRRGKRRSG